MKLDITAGGRSVTIDLTGVPAGSHIAICLDGSQPATKVSLGRIAPNGAASEIRPWKPSEGGMSPTAILAALRTKGLTPASFQVAERRHATTVLAVIKRRPGPSMLEMEKDTRAKPAWEELTRCPHRLAWFSGGAYTEECREEIAKALDLPYGQVWGKPWREALAA